MDCTGELLLVLEPMAFGQHAVEPIVVDLKHRSQESVALSRAGDCGNSSDEMLYKVNNGLFENQHVAT